MKKVAVTGSTAAGKSAVCKIFASMGAHTVSADHIAHQLLDPQTELGKQILSLFGQEVLVEGNFDREQIAQKAFHTPALLDRLEKLLHPPILNAIEEAAAQTDASLFVAEVPLLFECGWEKHFDTTIVVVAEDQKRKERFMKGCFAQRESRLLSQEEKKARADYVIENNGSLAALKTDVSKILTN